MKFSDLQLKKRGRRPDVRKLRRIIGPGKTSSERGRTYMTFDSDDFSDEDHFDKIYNLLQQEFGEPKELQYGGYRFGDFTLKKMNYGNELTFSYM